MSCHAVRLILHREASSLDGAERLVLEDHLRTCDECRVRRDVLVRSRDAIQVLPRESIGSRGYTRAIAGALLARADQQVAPRTGPSRFAVLLACSLAASVALALIAVFATRSSPSPEVATPALENDRKPVLPEHAPAPTRPEPTADRDVVLADRSTLALPTATVTAIGASELGVREEGRVIRLSSGRVQVEVDPKTRSALRVVTASFAVDVTGTVFEVSMTEVSVSRGSVRVTDLSGAILVDRLAAGASWPDRVATPPRGTDAPPPPSAKSWLDRAHAAFTARDFKTAERFARNAIDGSPARSVAAEAYTLQADSALALGQLDLASERYRTIADRFADLPAGETSLVALARLELRRGDITAARSYLDRYLQRYPRGRFVDLARRLKETSR